MNSIVIAIDGPAASGKGAIARAIAQHYSFAHLDTGLLYRAIANILITNGILKPTDEEAVEAAKHIRDEIPLERLESDTRLRSEKVSATASAIAAIPQVRDQLVALQRNFAKHPPNNAAGVVMEGRDIATVICPWAQVQLYVDASLETRARRRFEEMAARARTAGTKPIFSSEQEALEILAKRDKRDTRRSNAPLKKAENALLLDTTKLDIKESIARSVDLIEAHLHSIKDIGVGGQSQ